MRRIRHEILACHRPYHFCRIATRGNIFSCNGVPHPVFLSTKITRQSRSSVNDRLFNVTRTNCITCLKRRHRSHDLPRPQGTRGRPRQFTRSVHLNRYPWDPYRLRFLATWLFRVPSVGIRNLATTQNRHLCLLRPNRGTLQPIKGQDRGLLQGLSTWVPGLELRPVLLANHIFNCQILRSCRKARLRQCTIQHVGTFRLINSWAPHRLATIRNINLARLFTTLNQRINQVSRSIISPWNHRALICPGSTRTHFMRQIVLNTQVAPDWGSMRHF